MSMDFFPKKKKKCFLKCSDNRIKIEKMLLKNFKKILRYEKYGMNGKRNFDRGQ